MPTNMITTAFVLLIPLPPNPLARSQYQQFPKVCQSRQRRFPPPWTVDEHNNACFIAKDATGQALAYVYFGRSPLSRQLRRARGAAAPRSIGPERTQQMPNSRHLSEMFR